MEGKSSICFLRRWVHNILIMDSELCSRSNSDHRVSFWKICISFAVKGESCVVNKTGLQVKNGHYLFWGSYLVLRDFHSSHISNKEGSWMEFQNLTFFFFKNSKLSLQVFQSHICKTLVLSLKTCFASGRYDMNLESHWRSNLERNSD